MARKAMERARDRSARPARRRRGRWSAEMREAFLAGLRETGNARATVRRLGHGNMFYKRRRRDPEFARDWAAAVAEADARLGEATSAFPQSKGGQSQGTVPSDCPRLLPTDAASLGGYLRPGRKRRQRRPEPVIRRTSNGRLQISLAREGHWTSEIEADFLARLRATGNFRASALAVGFQPASVHDRLRKWPAFARACEEALEAASVQIDFRLTAHAHALLRKPEEAREAGDEEDVPFDPEAAMKILAFMDARKGGRTSRGRRKGPPERSFREAVDSILAKIDAIERHAQRMKARDGGGEDSSRPDAEEQGGESPLPDDGSD